MIYFIQAASASGPIKIGYTSRSVDERLAEIQAYSPVKLVVLLELDGEQADEQELHQKFILYRSHGEWFAPTQDLLAFIKKHGGKCAGCGSLRVVQVGQFHGVACRECLDKLNSADALRAKLVVACGEYLGAQLQAAE